MTRRGADGVLRVLLGLLLSAVSAGGVSRATDIVVSPGEGKYSTVITPDANGVGGTYTMYAADGTTKVPAGTDTPFPDQTLSVTGTFSVGAGQKVKDTNGGFGYRHFGLVNVDYAVVTTPGAYTVSIAPTSGQGMRYVGSETSASASDAHRYAAVSAYSMGGASTTLRYSGGDIVVSVSRSGTGGGPQTIGHL